MSTRKAEKSFWSGKALNWYFQPINLILRLDSVARMARLTGSHSRLRADSLKMRFAFWTSRSSVHVSFSFILAMLLPMGSGCYGQNSRPHDWQVAEISAVMIGSSAQEGAAGACRAWSLTAAEAEELFALSEQIDARAFHHDYDTAPCKISGIVNADGRTWRFTINGAAKAIWRSGSDTRYFGCRAQECESLVQSAYTGTDI